MQYGVSEGVQSQMWSLSSKGSFGKLGKLVRPMNGAMLRDEVCGILMANDDDCQGRLLLYKAILKMWWAEKKVVCC